METVETARQARYLAQLQTGAHSDGDLCQAAGAAYHALGTAAGLLAGTQSQPAQSQAGRAMDDAVLGSCFDRGRAGADDCGANRSDDAEGLYHQYSSQAAQYLSTPGRAQARSRLRLMRITAITLGTNA